MTENKTRTVSGNKKGYIFLLLFLAVWLLSFAVFYLLMSPSDAMGYSVVFLWVLIPVTVLSVSLLISLGGYFRRFKWALPLILGLMYMLSEYLTFGLSNMLAFGTFILPQYSLFLAGAFISFIGVIIGCLGKTK